MEQINTKPCSCSHCLKEVLQDDFQGQKMRWDEYGRGDGQCSRCLTALKGRMESSDTFEEP